MLEVSRLRLWLLLLLPTVVAMLAARGETRFVITLRTGGLTRRNVSEVRALTVFDARRRRGGMDEGAHLAPRARARARVVHTDTFTAEPLVRPIDS